MNLLFSLGPFFFQRFVRGDICRVESTVQKCWGGAYCLLHGTAPCQSNSGHFTWPSSWFKQFCSWGEYKEKEHSAPKRRVDLVCGDYSVKRPSNLKYSARLLGAMKRSGQCEPMVLALFLVLELWHQRWCCLFPPLSRLPCLWFQPHLALRHQVRVVDTYSTTATTTTNWKHISNLFICLLLTSFDLRSVFCLILLSPTARSHSTGS